MPDSLLPDDAVSPDEAPSSREHEYVVVARRYRPQAFEELIGQQHVARALGGAIESNRIGHAYLFTGARGVGKTSAARIFAKALNCVTGPTATPCNRCDVCESITSGDDVDVLEIDGASNRGIDDIRQLRQNVNVRPSRSRFKVYIIDEVHMLTKESFNALLKTLEEPPEHVKFIFCTTEPEKIPITILSRCQRFDFAGIETASIAERLRQIAEREKAEVDPEAIDLLARRAAGSMRDSQSLLEQIMAVSGGRISVDDVQRLLGIAGDARLATLVAHLVERNAAGALAEVDAAVRQGVDVAQLLDQLIGYLRDLLAASVGCSPDQMLYVSPSRTAEMAALGPKVGVHTLLAMLQILEQAAWRLKQTTHGRTVVELALVRLCRLEELDDLATMVEQLNAGGARAATPRPASTPIVKKNIEPQVSPALSTQYSVPGTVARSSVSPAPTVPSSEIRVPSSTEPPALTDDEARSLWNRVVSQFHDLLADQAAMCDRVSVAAPGRLVAHFSKKLSKTFCERPEQTARLEEALSAAAGGPIRVAFASVEESASDAKPPAPVGPSKAELRRDKSQQPWVRKALELYDGRIVDVLPPE